MDEHQSQYMRNAAEMALAMATGSRVSNAETGGPVLKQLPHDAPSEDPPNGEAQAEPMVRPHSIAHDLRKESVAWPQRFCRSVLAGPRVLDGNLQLESSHSVVVPLLFPAPLTAAAVTVYAQFSSQEQPGNN